MLLFLTLFSGCDYDSSISVMDLAGLKNVLLDILPIDELSKALISIDFEHHEMHEGNHYFGKQSSSISGGGTEAEFLFTTPDTTTRVHAKASFSGTDEFLVQLYEDVTTTDNGTVVVTFNNDRDSLNTPELTAYTGPTVTDDGTLIWEAYISGDKGLSGVSQEFGYEIVAKTNSTYLFRITKINAGTHIVDTNFWWYEH